MNNQYIFKSTMCSVGGTKANTRVCPLPRMAEDEITTLSTGVVLLNILNLCGLIEVDKLVDGRSNVGEGDLNTKWLYLFGDGLTKVRLKFFIDAIHEDSISTSNNFTGSLGFFSST